MAIFKKGDNYYIDYYFKGRRKREKVGPSRRLAEIALKKRQVEIAEGKFLDVKKVPKITFEEMIDKYLEWSKVNKRSWERDKLSLMHLKKFFAGKTLPDISAFAIEGYKAKRRAEVSPRTVNIELACLRHLFNKAIEWGFTLTNPFRKVKLFRENNQRTRFLSQEECERLIEYCPVHLKPLVIVALNTGMRKGELLALRWKNIDFVSNIINVETSKSGEGRQIPMNVTVKEILLKIKGKNVNDSEHVFFTNRGKPLKEPRVGFERTLKKAGIEGATFHTLRHTFASHLVMNGVDLKTVQELLGHKTFSVTLRYSHLSQSHKKEAVKVLDGHYLDTSNDINNTKIVVSIGKT